MWSPFFGDVHAAENLNPTGDRRADVIRQFVDLGKHTIDAKSNIANITPRFNVNVAGPLFKRLLQEPIDDADHVLIVRVEFLH